MPSSLMSPAWHLVPPVNRTGSPPDTYFHFNSSRLLRHGWEKGGRIKECNLLVLLNTIYVLY